MATSAQIQASINGGAFSSGGLTAAFTQSVALQAANTSGWTQSRWEIYDYPPGFSAPAGWSTDASGVIFFAPANPTTPPPSFNLPSSGSNNWGLFMLRLRINGNPLRLNADGSQNAQFIQLFTDESTVISLPSPTLGMNGFAFNLSTQYDALRGWAGEIQAALRVLDAGNASITWANDLAGNGTSSNTHQYVSSLSFSSAAAGGQIAINGTGTSFQWAAGNTGPAWFHAQNTAGAGVDTAHHTQAAKTGSAAEGGNFRVAIGKNDAASQTAYFAVAIETAVGGASTDYLRIVPNATGFSFLYDNGNSGIIIGTNSGNSDFALTLTRGTSAKLNGPGPITMQPADGSNFIIEGNNSGNLYWQFTTTNGGANSLTHVTSSTSVTYKQADNTAASATGAATTLQAQNATGTTATGGALNLTSGTGTTINGAINLQFGGTTLQALNGNGVTWTSASQALASTATVTLSAAQYLNPLIVLTGTLTTSVTLVFPNSAGWWLVDVSGLTLGANTLAFKSGSTTTSTISSIATTSTIFMIRTTGSNGISVNV